MKIKSQLDRLITQIIRTTLYSTDISWTQYINLKIFYQILNFQATTASFCTPDSLSPLSAVSLQYPFFLSFPSLLFFLLFLTTLFSLLSPSLALPCVRSFARPLVFVYACESVLVYVCVCVCMCVCVYEKCGIIWPYPTRARTNERARCPPFIPLFTLPHSPHGPIRHDLVLSTQEFQFGATRKTL